MNIGEAVEWIKGINWRKVNVVDVLEGCSEAFLGDWLGRGQEMDEVIKYRLKQCADCPVYNNGGCDPNRQRKHVSTGKIVYGCGCNIRCKSALKSQECPAGLWYAVS